MGKLPSQPEPPIHHFSHPHPLQLSNYHTQQTPNSVSCSVCKVKASGGNYTCVHISCSKLPQQITHPFDHQNHVLSLLPKPAYSQGFFNCDTCGEQGNGFSYHCGTCNIDLHTICATLPLLLSHQSHPHHLNLTFSPPYNDKGFSCDICKNMGSNEWLNRCNLCEFDAHLVCATENAKAPIQQAQVQHFQAPTPIPTTYYQVPGSHYSQTPLLQNYTPTLNNMNNNIPGALGAVRSVGRGPPQQNVMLNQYMMGLFQGFGQSLGNAGGDGSAMTDCGVDSSVGDGSLFSSFNNGDLSGGFGGMDLGGLGEF
ncbi:hypothetical protein ACOSQ2_019414 [Xanthoceras sorbifolium]